jgi:hypothetical protein
MLRGLRVLAAVLVLTVSVPVTAQVPTAEQLELLRSMSPEDREALLEQLGLGGAVIGDGGQSGSMTSGSSRRPTNRDTDEKRLLRGEELGLDGQPLDKTLKPEDTILLELDFKKDKPPRIESPGVGLPPITIPGEAAPVLEPAERDELQLRMNLIASRNPYQLDSNGTLTLPGFAPIMLAGLNEERRPCGSRRSMPFASWTSK